MPAPSTSKPRKPKPAYNRKLNEKRVLQLSEQGFSSYEIAKTQGVNQSSVHRFLDRYQIEKAQTETYKINRANLLSHTGSKFHSLASQLADEIQRDIDNGVTGALSPGDKGKLARDLAVVQGVLYDKERLEAGLSTDNVAVLGKIMATAVERAFTGSQGSDKKGSSDPKLGAGHEPEQAEAMPAAISVEENAGVRGDQRVEGVD